MKTTILIALILFTQLSMAEEVYYSCKGGAGYQIKFGKKTLIPAEKETLDIAVFPTGTMIILDRKFVLHKIKYHKANALAFEKRELLKAKGGNVVKIMRVVLDTYGINTLGGSFSMIGERREERAEITKSISCIKLNAQQNFLNQAFR